MFRQAVSGMSWLPAFAIFQWASRRDALTYSFLFSVSSRCLDVENFVRRSVSANSAMVSLLGTHGSGCGAEGWGSSWGAEAVGVTARGAGFWPPLPDLGSSGETNIG